MKKVFYIFLFLVSFVSFAQTNDTLSFRMIIDSLDYSSLKKNWKFKAGDDLSWKEKDFDDSDWILVERNSSGEIIEKEIDFGGKAWLRKSLEIDSTLVGIPLSLNFEIDPGVFSVYINGKHHKTFGKRKTKNQSEVSHVQNNPVNLDFIDFIFTETGKQTIAIQYENSTVSKTSDYLNPKIKIITQQEAIVLANKMKTAGAAMSFFGSVFITLFVFHLILFLYYREFIPNLYFSLFNFSIGFSFFMFVYLFINGFNLNSITITGIVSCILVYISSFSLSGLVNSLFSINKRRFKIFTIISIIGLLIIFVKVEISVIISILLFIYAFIEATVLLLKAIFKKVKGARILASGILLTIFFTLLLIIFMIYIATKDNGKVNINYEESATIAIIIAILFFGTVISVFSIPFSMSAYLAWYFSFINKENEQKLIEVEHLTQENLNQEKDKLSLIENINQELEAQVDNRKNEIEIQKSEIEIQNKTLEIEKAKSELLLLNILPEEIALELKEKGKSQSKFFDSVTILFTDFKDFTKLAEKVSSTELIEELNYCFKEFDRIISKYGIEKIKTIGDAYMAVSGLPIKDENHAVKMVNASLEIRDFMEDYKQKRISEGKEYFEMRIGINSGEVVAGIVGIKKFAYDIWGTAVNVASDMEVNGKIGRVNISENTYKLIKNNFDSELRDEIAEDSDVRMYFVEPKSRNMNFESAKNFIINKQTEELPSHLHYHNIDHILDVYDAVIRYAKLEGLSDEETQLVEMAALFHDSGFIVKAENHEMISCDFAERYLMEFGYDFKHIDKIKGIIMATKIPQTPTNHLEEILADADLDYLGRDDFQEIANRLYEELKFEGKVSDINSWNKIQISFFEKHKYFTASAKRLRNKKKQENLDKIKSETQF